MASSDPWSENTTLTEEEQGATFTRRRRRDDAEMDITPMIDITFLLLIFFLVSAKLEPSASVKLPPAQRGDSVAAKQSIIICVTQEGDTPAKVYIGNSVSAEFLITSPDLEEQEQLIADYVAAGLAGDAPFDLPKQFVMIKAERNVKHREIARVAQAVGKGGGGEIQAMHVAVLEGK